METGTIKKMKDTENKDGNRGKKKLVSCGTTSSCWPDTYVIEVP